VLIAGLLHDSLEDVPGYNKEKLEEEFGSRVTQIVLGVTEPLDANKALDDQKPWLERKEAYTLALKNGPAESALVSCADKIHNLMSTEYTIEMGDVVLFEKMQRAFTSQKLFYDGVFEVCELKLGGDHVLVKDFKQTFERVV
jgi:(p)ppGpp synthase/HD superfamily hydrolase